jgi:hypothetical protein
MIHSDMEENTIVLHESPLPIIALSQNLQIKKGRRIVRSLIHRPGSSSHNAFT